ncbi:cytochrome o ubiquinol oxidase subunit IV [Candidatus Saccharibacteria bacterium]|nr:MAG: cytochrome o ubiquinol oxidase subunit IV [Candidatus Saccharibacteria bacterium]
MKLPSYIQRLPNFREASLATYLAGFGLSVALTLSAFALVWAYRVSDGLIFSRGFLLLVLAVLATSQIVVQVLFFLHMSTERRLKMNLYGGIFTIFVVLCLVVGSIWIMQNLDYNMMPTNQTEHIEYEESIRQP